MNRNAGPESDLQSRRLGSRLLLILYALVPLVYLSNLYSYSLLPKRLLVQCAVTLISFLWLLDYRAKRNEGIRPTPLYLPLVCYILVCAIAVSQALNPLDALVDVAHQLTFALLFFLVLHTFCVGEIPKLLRTCACVGIFVSIVGILESRGFNLDFPISNGRPSATFEYRNFAASFLIMTIPLTGMLWLQSRDLKDHCLGAISTGLMAVFLIYTRSRGAWIGLAGSTVLTCLLVGHARWHWKTPFGLQNPFLRSHRAKLVSMAVMAVTLGLSLLPPEIDSTQSRAIDEQKSDLLDALSFLTTSDSDRGRIDIWENTLGMIQDNLLLGVGPGNWKFVYPRYDEGDMIRADSAPRRPHNEFLSIASETGLLGLSFYLWFLLTIGIVTVRILRKPASPDHPRYAVAFAASLLAMLGHGMVSFPRELAETSLIFWSGLGILALLGTPSISGKERKRKQQPSISYAVHMVPLILLFSALLTYRQIRFDKHYLSALQFHRGNDFRSTLQEANAALNQGPFDPQIFLLRGDGYQALGLTSKAGESYAEGLLYHPHSIQLLGALGTSYALGDKLDLAEEYYRRVLEIYPGYYQMQNNLGGIHQKRGNLDAAIAAYKKVLEVDPKYLDAYSNLGLAYLESNRTEEAIRTYHTALEYAPDDPVLQHNLGDAYYQQSNLDPKALFLAQKAYGRFLDSWRGPQEQAMSARERIAEIQKFLGGATR